MRRFAPSRRAAVVIVVALLAVGFAVRIALSVEPGPVLLIPALLAGYWFGARGGIGVGILAGALFALSKALNANDADTLDVALEAGVRTLIYMGAGGLVGAVVEQRAGMAATLQETQHRLEELRELQEALTPPKVPDRPGLDIAACFTPAESSAIGGDFYLVAEGPNDSTIVAVGDVVGKGPEAARRAAFVRATIANLAAFSDDPCRLLELTNQALIERTGTTHKFTTAVCVSYRPRDRCLTWAFAGHVPPHWLDSGKPLNGVRPGAPLGVSETLECTANSRTLEPGEGVLLYTDGLEDARSQSSDRFGVARVTYQLTQFEAMPPGEVVDRLTRLACDFADGSLPDDICLVALRAVPGPGSASG